jgi:hypothetical protein
MQKNLLTLIDQGKIPENINIIFKPLSEPERGRGEVPSNSRMF